MYACRIFGPAYEVWSLNNILRNNLKNNISLGFGSNPPTNPPAKAGWIVTFSDEFSGNSIDTTKWYRQMTDRPNPFSDVDKFVKSGVVPLEYYDDSAVSVSNNTVKLLLDYAPKTFVVKDWNGPIIDPNTGQPYSVTINHKAGVLISKKTESWGEVKNYSQRFGFFETRCRLPNSKATWPAFWLSGLMDWPPEIDIFEIFTSKSFHAFESNYHWGIEKDCFQHESDSAGHDVNDVSGAFHTYGCEWDSCFIKWYYDNMLVRVAHEHVHNVFEPMIIILGNGIDSMNEPNFASVLTLPAIFEVDYVRVYRRP
jgi:beta-glucanase (GH16 family)